MIFNRVNRWDEPLGTVRALDATYQVSTSGIDQLNLLTFDDMTKGDKIIWKDPDTGEIHEHEVSEIKRVHDSDGKPLTSAVCINSICELYGDRYISAVDVPSGTETIENMGAGIQAALSQVDSRWTFGGDGGYGTNISAESVTIQPDRDSLRSFLAKVVAAKKAELRTHLEQTDGVITSRTFYVYGTPAITDETATPKHRFTYKKNLSNVTREVLADEVYTAVKGLGAPILDANGNETGQRLTVEFKASDTYLNNWGRLDKNGNRKHTWTYFEDSECDDELYLLSECGYYHASVMSPKIRYTLNIADMGSCDIGDYVDVIDTDFNEPIRIRARITEINKNLLDKVHGGVITIGTPNYPMLEAYKKSEKLAETDSQSKTSQTSARIDKLDKQMNDTVTGIKPQVLSLNDQINDSETGIQKQVDDINDWIEEHGSGGGNVGKFSWWDLQTDSFAFFDTACNFGLTGKGSTIGCYQKQSGINPDPSTPVWLEGAEVWTALAATDHADSVSKVWLRVPKLDTSGSASGGLATPRVALTQDPRSQYGYISQIVRSPYNDIGFFNSGHYGIKNQAGDPLPTMAIRPQESGYGVILLTGRNVRSGDSGPKNDYSGNTFLTAYDSGLGYEGATRLLTLDSNVNVSGGKTSCAMLELESRRTSSKAYGSFQVRVGTNNGAEGYMEFYPKDSDNKVGDYNGVFKINWGGNYGHEWYFRQDGKLYYDNTLVFDANAS